MVRPSVEYGVYFLYPNLSHIRVLQMRYAPRGRPRLLEPYQFPCLLLAWHRTRGLIITLYLLFGVSHRVASLQVHFSRLVLYCAVVKNVHVRVALPTPRAVKQFKLAFNQRHSLHRDMYSLRMGSSCI